MIQDHFYKIKCNKKYNLFNKILQNFYKYRAKIFMIKQTVKWDNKKNKNK